jgi:hypothetical protein
MLLHTSCMQLPLNVARTAGQQAVLQLHAVPDCCYTPQICDRLLLVLELLPQQVLQGGCRLGAAQTQQVLPSWCQYVSLL